MRPRGNVMCGVSSQYKGKNLRVTTMRKHHDELTCNNIGAVVAPVPRISLNTDDAAKAIGVSKRTLLAILADGELPYIEAGPQTFLFDPADLVAWLNRKKKTKGAKNGEHLN